MREAGIVAVSDDGKPIATAKLARQIMEYCKSMDIPVIEHAEDVSLAAGAVMREGVTSSRLGLRGMPAAARIRVRRARRATRRAYRRAPCTSRTSAPKVRWIKCATQNRKN